jgi:hypothetical protein
MICSVITVITLVSFVSYLISHRMTSSFEDAQFTMMGQVMQSKLRDAESKAIATAEMVAAMPAVKKAFAAHDRTGLLAATKGAYRVQLEKYGVSQAHFHVAPAVSFLRVHNPEKFGDDLSGNRQMVIEVNRTNGIRKGLEVTSSGIGIFGTMPVHDELGKSVGSFEVGMEVAPLLDELKNTYGFELGFFVEENILRETATAMKGDIYKDENRVGSYIKFASTHPDLLRSLVSDADINAAEQVQYLRDANNVPYGVLLQPVYNYAKKQIGVMVIVSDFTETRSADGQSVVWQILLALASGLLQIGVIMVVVRGMVIRPLDVLNERVAAQADGADARDLPETERWCDEMRDLVESCDRLAVRATDGSGKGDAS